MVHRAADHQGAGRRLRRQLSASGSGSGSGGGGRQQKEVAVPPAQELVRLPCNKGKACRFKRSCFSEEDDAASAAMLLLACVVCAPSV